MVLPCLIWISKRQNWCINSTLLEANDYDLRPLVGFFYMWMILLSCGMQRDLWWQSQGSSKLKPPVRASQAAESWIFEIRNHELFSNISSSQNYRTAYVYRIRYFFETRCNYIILYLFLQAAEKCGLSWNGFSESTFVSARLFLFCFPHMKILYCDFFHKIRDAYKKLNMTFPVR